LWTLGAFNPFRVLVLSLLIKMRACSILTALSLPALTLTKRQAYVTRHCVRSGENDTALAQFTVHSMPDWGVPAGWCTEAGTDMMAKTGKDLVENFGFDPTRVRFISDPNMRDIDSCYYMMQGMGIPHAAIDVDHDLFNPSQCICHAGESCLDGVHAERRAKFNEMLAFQPFDYKTSLAELQDIIGVGAAGRLEDIDGPDAGIIMTDQGKPGGAMAVMAMFGNTMLDAYASNIPFMNVTEEQMIKFNAWHSWYATIGFVDNSFMPRWKAPLVHRIINDLKTASTTNVFIGHDGDVSAFVSILGLKWNAPPYAPAETKGELAHTLPGDGLLLEFDDDNTDEVTLSFVYRVYSNLPDDVFKLTRIEVAKFASMLEFEQAIMSGLKRFDGAEECYGNAGVPLVV